MPFNKQHYIVGTKITQTNLDFIIALLGDLPINSIRNMAVILFAAPDFMRVVHDKLVSLDFFNVIQPTKSSLLQTGNVYLLAHNTPIALKDDVIYLPQTTEKTDENHHFEVLAATYHKNFIQLIWDENQTQITTDTTILVSQNTEVESLKNQLLLAVAQADLFNLMSIFTIYTHR